MPNGTAVCNFAVATSEKWKDKQTGQDQEKTEFHNLTAFGKTAEVIGEHFHKGKPIYVEGQNRTRSYPHKQYPDVTMYRTEVKVDLFQFVPSSGRDQPQRSQQPQAQTPPQFNPDEDFNDDLAF